MDAMENRLVILLGIVALCVVAEDTGITIGIIADSSDAAVVRETDTDIASDVSAVWQYVDYSDTLRFYGAVRHFDLNPDVDLIVLTGYVPSPSMPLHLLDARNKHVVKLHKDPTKETKELLISLTRQYLNESWAPPVRYSMEPVCKEVVNVSLISSSDVLLTDTIATAPAEIFARLVKGEGESWKTLHVFHDTASEKETQIFVDSLSLYGITFTLFNVDHVQDMHALLMKVYQVPETMSKPQMNIAVVCRLDGLFKVFHAANEFDDLDKQNPTLITLFSRWLVIVYNYSSLVAATLERIASELSNVAILVVPELSPIPTPSIMTYLQRNYADLQSVFQEVDSNGTVFQEVDSNGTVFQEVDSNRNQLDNIIMSLRMWDPVNNCDGYVIKTLLWTKSGRDFSDVGHAYLNTSVHLSSELFPNIKYGYSQKLLTVSTLEYPPFTIEYSNNGTRDFNGVCIELLQELAKTLNFTYKIVPPPDNNWGSVDHVENGTFIFNGIIGELQRYKVDLAAAPLTIIPEREQAVDFSYPFYYEYTTVLLKKPDPNAYKWRTLLDPFKPTVLGCIGVSWFLVSLVVFLIEKYGNYYTVPEHAAKRKADGVKHNLPDICWYIYSALFYQGNHGLPESFAGRIMVMGWWLFCIVIVGTYCGNLIAFLTVHKDITPFNTLEEMAAKKGEFKWGTLGSTNWEVVFKTSPIPDYRKIGDAMMEWNETDPGVFSRSIAYHINRVKKGGYAFIGDFNTVELAMDEECDLTIIKEKFLPMRYAFGFQPNSPHNAIFSDQVMKSQEAGLFEIWRRNWLAQKNICLTGALPEAKPITLEDVQAAFFLCAGGAVLGSVAVVMEMIIFRCRKKSSGNAGGRTPGERTSRKNPSSEQTLNEPGSSYVVA